MITLNAESIASFDLSFDICFSSSLLFLCHCFLFCRTLLADCKDNSSQNLCSVEYKCSFKYLQIHANRSYLHLWSAADQNMGTAHIQTNAVLNSPLTVQLEPSKSYHPNICHGTPQNSTVDLKKKKLFKSSTILNLKNSSKVHSVFLTRLASSSN